MNVLRRQRIRPEGSLATTSAAKRAQAFVQPPAHGEGAESGRVPAPNRGDGGGKANNPLAHDGHSTPRLSRNIIAALLALVVLWYGSMCSAPARAGVVHDTARYKHHRLHFRYVVHLPEGIHPAAIYGLILQARARELRFVKRRYDHALALIRQAEASIATARASIAPSVHEAIRPSSRHRPGRRSRSRGDRDGGTTRCSPVDRL